MPKVMYDNPHSQDRYRVPICCVNIFYEYKVMVIGKTCIYCGGYFKKSFPYSVRYNVKTYDFSSKFSLKNKRNLLKYRSTVETHFERIMDFDFFLKCVKFGSDDENGMRSALKSNFPHSATYVCSRHLKQNVNEYLTNKIGVDIKTRQEIEADIFGPDGISTELDANVIDRRMQSMLHKYNLVDTQFQTYAKRRNVPILKENCDLPELVRNQERRCHDGDATMLL